MRRCRGVNGVRAGHDRTSNIEHSTSNIQRMEYFLQLRCWMFAFRWLVLLVVLVAACSCRTALRNDERVRALDEIPLEQLRVFLKGHVGDWRGDTDQAKGVPPPPIQKPCPEDAALIDLVKPENLDVGNVPLAGVVGRRRSRREYSGAWLSNEELSFLLWCTQGISETVRNEEGKAVYCLRTVPSAGARHPFETYLLINRVAGIEPGIYRFLALEHKLVLIREDRGLPQAAADACYGQMFVGEAAVVFVWTAIPRRTEWRYGYVAHRMIAMEAGHVCQNLYLAAESIGAGACAVLGYDQERMDSLIGVDGTDEFTIYMASVGKTR